MWKTSGLDAGGSGFHGVLQGVSMSELVGKAARTFAGAATASEARVPRVIVNSFIASWHDSDVE